MLPWAFPCSVALIKTAEPIDMPFGVWTQVGQRNHVLDGVQIAPCQGAIFRGKNMPGHARRHCSQLCKNGSTDRDAVWVVDSGRSKEACIRSVHLRRRCGLFFVKLLGLLVITFHVRHSRDEMYSSHDLLCVCLSLSTFPPRRKMGNGRGCPLVVHYWAHLQSVHEFRCYDNTEPNAKCQRVLVLAVCLVNFVVIIYSSSNNDMKTTTSADMPNVF